ncbi:MAG: 3-deoxy-manno-octulosonate cytidylyltransferase [Bacteroidetes bacterium]|nr:3-deoxy-manno-octulosonate cytidylyltransferase [Bacteroidota bacterium]
MNILGIIPARFASSRFPGKPLSMIYGKSMIQRVYDRVSRCQLLSDIIVATDDERIYDHVAGFGGKVLMTSQHHQSGTERCNEVVDTLFRREHKQFDVIINIQGDEPFINPEQITQLAECFQDSRVELSTLIKKITTGDDLDNPNVVKVIIDNYAKAIYFSRFPVPFLRGIKKENRLPQHIFYKHIGIYGYTPVILRKITSLPESSLERAESLEQLRWLENGFSIHTRKTEFESIAIDTPDDLLQITNTGE